MGRGAQLGWATRVGGGQGRGKETVKESKT